jgi:uncharacterized repeat protein (TIGR01451 family)
MRRAALGLAVVVVFLPLIVIGADEALLGPDQLRPAQLGPVVSFAGGTESRATLYTNTTQTGSRFNPGNTTFIVYDDVPIPVARLGASSSVDLTQVTVGIRQVAGAPAVNVDIFVSTLTSNPTAPDTEINPPGTFLCTVALPARSASTTSLATCGTGTTTIATVPLNMDLVAGSGTFAVGVRLSEFASGFNGWRLTSGPDPNGDYFWLYDPAGPTESVNWFGGSPVATFYIDVQGTPVPPATGIYLTPPTEVTDGCNSVAQTHTLSLYNDSGSNGTFSLAYAGTGDATVSGPSSVVVAQGATVPFDVTITPDVCALGEAIELTVTATGNTYSDSSTITQNVVGGGVWSQVATEPDSGRLDNVTAAYDGKVWSITGYGTNANVRTYDPVTKAWTSVASSAPTFGVNYAHSGCTAGSKVFVYGDAATTNFTGLWSYDMAANVWTAVTPSGTGPTPTGIWAPAWVSDPATGYCYLTGGATVAGAGDLATVHVYDPGDLATVHVYDPATNAWLAPLPSFTLARDFHAAFLFTHPVSGHKLLCVAGGYNVDPTPNGTVLDTTQCYDFATAAWNAEGADLGVLPAAWWGMGYAQKVHLGTDLQLWVVQGSAGAYTAFYDFTWNSWTLGDDPATAAVYRLSAVTLNNEIYKLGGTAGSFVPSGATELHTQCTESCEADLQITKNDGVVYVAPGATLTYTITASNAGPGDTYGYVEDTLPTALTGATWTCTGSGGGVCTASGSGDIGSWAWLPAGGSATYLVTATVAAGTSGSLANTAGVYPLVGLAEPSILNNRATDTDLVEACLFCDGFESGPSVILWSSHAP